MYVLLAILVWAFLIVLAASSFLSAIMVITLSGYFFGRVLLKVLGLYSASPEAFRKELKVAGMVGMLVLFTITCVVVMELVGYWTGVTD